MPVTSGDGDRVYCQLLDEEIDPELSKKSKTQRVQMLSRPISTLIAEVENDATAAAIRESSRLKAAAERRQVIFSSSSLLKVSPRCQTGDVSHPGKWPI